MEQKKGLLNISKLCDGVLLCTFVLLGQSRRSTRLHRYGWGDGLGHVLPWSCDSIVSKWFTAGFAVNCNQATIIRGWGPGHQQTLGYGGSLLYKPNLELCVNIVMPIGHNWKVTLAQRGSTTDGPMIFYERDVWQCAKYNLMRKVQFNAHSTIHRWKYLLNTVHVQLYNTTLNGHIWLLHPFTSTPWVGRTFMGLIQASDEKYLRWIALIRND